MKKTYLEILTRKNSKSISEHLVEAINDMSVNSKYEPIKMERQKSESTENFISRVVAESSTFQFVKVVHGGKSEYVAFGVPGPIITKFGNFTLISAEVIGGRWGTHYLLIYPGLENVLNQSDLLVRIDSGCVSGQVFEDITCDCKAQLNLTRQMCVENGSGIIVHIPQHDGRGWGEFKMANQRIMNEIGCDTVEAANLFYGEKSSCDQRTYEEAVLILKALGIEKDTNLNLATNNPRKKGAFLAAGFNVTSSRSVLPKNIDVIAQKSLRAKGKHWKHCVEYDVEINNSTNPSLLKIKKSLKT